jgi:hypothetical protein
MQEITYSQAGDYLLPYLALPEYRYLRQLNMLFLIYNGSGGLEI